MNPARSDNDLNPNSSTASIARPNVQATPIQTLQQRPDLNNPVYLEGEVGQQAPFVGSRAYELRDATGTIWVVTKAKPMRSGSRVLVKGQPRYQTVASGGQQTQELYLDAQEQWTEETK